MDLDDGVTLRAADDPKLACKHLVGCFLACYAVARPRVQGGFCALNCRDVAVEATGTGALGVMGNKGACCIRSRSRGRRRRRRA